MISVGVCGERLSLFAINTIFHNRTRFTNLFFNTELIVGAHLEPDVLISALIHTSAL